MTSDTSDINPSIVIIGVACVFAIAFGAVVFFPFSVTNSDSNIKSTTVFVNDDMEFDCKPYLLKVWANDKIDMHGYQLKMYLSDESGDSWKFLGYFDGDEDDFYTLGTEEVCQTGLDFPDDDNSDKVFDRINNQTMKIAVQLELDDYVKVGLIEPPAYSFGSTNGTSWKNYSGELLMLDLDEDGKLEETIVDNFRYSAMRGGGLEYQYSCRNGGACGDIVANVGIDGHVLFCDVKDQTVCFMGIKK